MDGFVAEFIIGPAEGGTRWLLAMAIIPDLTKIVAHSIPASDRAAL